MKKNIIAKIGAAAVVLTIVTTSLVGGTFAKYTSTVSGEVSASVAAWKIAFKEGNNNITTTDPVTIALNNKDTTLGDGKIAPGSSGQIELTVDGTDTEVNYDYKIVADLTSLGGVPIKFYKDADYKTPFDYDTENGTLITLDSGSVDISVPDVVTKKTVTVYWAWDTGEKDTEKIDAADTTAGKSASTGTINVTMTATQKTAPAPTGN